MMIHDKMMKDFIRDAYFLNTRFFLWTLVTAFGMIWACEGVLAGDGIVYDPHKKRDPFTPLVSTASKVATGLAGVESPEDIAMEGIVYDPQRDSIVIVNGTVLREGEELSNLKVLEIKPEGAWFLLNGARVFRPIYQDEAQKERDL